MSAFDPRITPARPDLAAEHLRGKVQAERYASGVVREVIVADTRLLRAPKFDAPVDTELLHGERFVVYEYKDHYAWGQAELDGYVGYVNSNQLQEPHKPATHRIRVPQSRLYPEADAKAFAHGVLSLGSKLRIQRDVGRFCETIFFGRKWFVPAVHVVPISEFVGDCVAVAEAFLGTPYVFGGRTSAGLDCSALVQLSLAEAGIKAPRDSDQQRDALGTSIGGAEALAQMQRGDLIFWKNHVAMATDGQRMIYANALAMAVSIDEAIPFARAVEPTEGPVIAVKRLK